jgi:hypothetical protein
VRALPRATAAVGQYLAHPIAICAPLVRSIAIAALMGATMLATPLTAAWAQNAPVKTAATSEAAQTKGETVEQRITTLHASLKITPAEETQWNGVAQAMRENAAAMDKLVAANRTTPPQNMTAVQDLQSYQHSQLGSRSGSATVTPFSGRKVAMTWINSNTSKRRLSAKLAGGAGISALLVLGAFAAPASAQWNSNPGYQQNSGGGY